MADSAQSGLLGQIRNIHHALPVAWIAVFGAIIAQPMGVVLTMMAITLVDLKTAAVKRQFQDFARLAHVTSLLPRR